MNNLPFAAMGCTPPLASETERLHIRQSLSWKWSERALHFLSIYQKLPQYAMPVDKLQSRLLASWGHIPQSLIDFQCELGGITIPDENASLTFGIQDLYSPVDFDIGEIPSEKICWFRHPTQFSYYLSHTGKIFFDDTAYALNANKLIEKMAFKYDSRTLISSVEYCASWHDLPQNTSSHIELLTHYAPSNGFAENVDASDAFGAFWNRKDAYISIETVFDSNFIFAGFKKRSDLIAFNTAMRQIHSDKPFTLFRHSIQNVYISSHPGPFIDGQNE